jgi:hypothetical protein
MNDNLTWSLGCVVSELGNKKLKKNVSISSNNKCCIEGGLVNFNYKRNLASRIILAFFPSLVASVLQHNHLVEPGVEGRKVTSHLAPKVLKLCTNHLVLVLCKPVWVSEACQFFLVPSRSFSMPLYPSKVLRARERARLFILSLFSIWDSHLSPSRS